MEHGSDLLIAVPGTRVATLHHCGDPTGNEGILLSAIVARPKVQAALPLVA